MLVTAAEEIISGTFHLALEEASYSNLTQEQELNVTEATLKFLQDNIGGVNKFSIRDLRVMEVKSDFEPLAYAGRWCFALKFNATFAIKQSFKEWIEKDDNRRLEPSRYLQTKNCNSKEYAECCVDGAINKERSMTCKKKGCSKNGCDKRPPKNPKNRRIMDSDHHTESRDARELEIDENLYGRSFTDVIIDYTDVSPQETRSILDASDTQQVATCSKATDTNNLNCALYESESCNEIEFFRSKNFC